MYSSCTCTCTHVEPPLFTVEPEDVHVVKKGFVVLPCAASSPGGEHTHIHWLQDTTNISRTGPRQGVLQDNSLLLTNMRVVDGGEYSCVASNQYGQSSSTATLTVSSELSCGRADSACVCMCVQDIRWTSFFMRRRGLPYC